MVSGTSVTVDRGTLPAPAPGFEAWVGTAMTKGRATVRLLAGGMLLGDQTTLIASNKGIATGGRFEALGLWGRACGALRVGRFDLGPCLAAEIDRISGVAVGAIIPIKAARSWGAGLASAQATWAITQRVSVALRIDGVLPLARPSFVLEGARADVMVHRPALVAVRGALGLEMRFF